MWLSPYRGSTNYLTVLTGTKGVEKAGHAVNQKCPVFCPSLCFEQHLTLAGLSSEDTEEERSPASVERSLNTQPSSEEEAGLQKVVSAMTLCSCIDTGFVLRLAPMLQHNLQALQKHLRQVFNAYT